MTSTSSPVHIDTLLTQITTSNSPAALNHTFKTAFTRDAREILLSSFLANGQDPLAFLDPAVNTIGSLYILSSRLHANYSNTPPPSWQTIGDFCSSFNADDARLAPERVTKLARGIQRYAAHIGTPSLAIQPLSDLVTRYPPTRSHLTAIHPIFLLTCVTTRHFRAALPVLAHPITEIDTTTTSPDLTYTDNLVYHYAGGIALAALKRWAAAEECFEICVTSPGTYPAALQMEALKKLRLVQLISTGTISNLPKYTHPLLNRMFKNTAYNAFINAYPKNTTLMREILEKERATFAQEKNIGLIQQAITRAPRWVLKKLTATYVTLHLSDIARAVEIESEDEVRALLLSMIESNDITATISASGTVTFSDPPAQFSKAQVDAALRGVQEQTALLAFLELEAGRSREFLGKVVKSNDGNWAPAPDEEIFANLGAQHMWEENIYS
ncbi:COP9 signalosome complex subunit 3 [Psilocybe cubensis]|uniref:COP9 signalosome complex subunit 3 n=2 Tax=Psilocybe cubensis TaxID=181762 RepID=A0ACB8GR18_PSICU|nr:COP9 signalosome complex subunit 3 [Psilocybe cubensis]KAH9477899.1 COP9 signalosome complex subunit 3 [Psilocybe cubensis]